MKSANKITFLLILFLSLCYAHAYAQRSVKLPAKKIASQTRNRKEGKYAYHVFGKHYQVLSTSKNYKERGIASWYGRAFHRKYTSSGERFNMYSMTAAHKSLPLPTLVQVTNLKNGRKVIVKVNDRGPFVSNRIIDLSYGAAKKLGMVSMGLAPVMVKALA